MNALTKFMPMRSAYGRIARVLGALLLITTAGSALHRGLTLPQFVHSNWMETELADAGGVDALTQTSDGYLWLGTANGLFRFDGARFVSWNEISDQAFPDNSVRALTADAQGSLWIATASSLSQLSHGKLSTLTVRNGLPGGTLIALLRDARSGVWVGTTGDPSSAVARVRNNSVKTFLRENSFENTSVLSLAAGHDGNVWVGTTRGVRELGPTGVEIKASHLGGEVFSLVEEANGDLVIGDRASKNIVRIASRDWARAKRVGNYPRLMPRVVMCDQDGNIWIGTLGGGLIRVRDGVIEQMTRRDGLSGDFVNAIFEDKDGNVWVGTDRGLDRLSNPTMTRLSRLDALHVSSVTVVQASRDGSLWLGTATSGTLHLQNGAIRRYRASLLGQTVLSMHEDTSGSMWVGTSHGLLHSINKRFIEVRAADGTAIDRVCSITSDRNGNTWVADGKQGLLRFHDGLVESIADGNGAYEVRVARDGMLWVGYYQGGITAFRGGVAVSHAKLGTGSIQSIEEDDRGTIWVGATGGLSRFRNGRWTNWTTAQGIPVGGVYGITSDGGFGLWAMSSVGLLHLPFAELDRSPDAAPQNIRYAVLGKSEGIRLAKERRLASPRASRSSDGRLWLITLDGLAEVEPGRRRNNNPPNTFIEEMAVDGRKINAVGRAPIVLQGRHVEFQYTAIDLSAPESIRFRYKLEDLDQEWREAGSTRRIAYGALSPGTYRFRVVARNGLGFWGQTGANILFRIDPIFYQTWWFRVGCIASLFLGLFGFFRVRVLQVRYGLHMMFQERLRVTRQLHDSLIQGFTGVVYQLDAALRMFDIAPAQTKSRLTNALQQADQALLEARQAITQLRLPALENHSLPEAIRMTAKQLVEGKSMSLDLNVQQEVERLPYEIQSEVFLIAREALTNAVNHSDAKRIILNLSYQQGRFHLQVKDDGRGFDSKLPAREGHLGLPGMQERAKRIHGILTITSAPGQGSSVEVGGTVTKRVREHTKSGDLARARSSSL